MAFDDLPVEPPVVPPSNPNNPQPPVLESRNVLDPNGNIIGTLKYPVGTSESIWSERIALYSTTVVNLAKKILEVLNLNASSQTTTSSGTASVINGMSKVVPSSGKYLVEFSGSIYTAGASATGEFGIYVDDVLVTETRRDISCNLTLLGGLVTISLNAIGVGTNTSTQLELTNNQTVDVRFRSTNGGTIGFKERVLTLLRVE